MSRRKPNKSKSEELNKEYKDPEIVEKDQDTEIVEVYTDTVDIRKSQKLKDIVIGDNVDPFCEDDVEPIIGLFKEKELERIKKHDEFVKRNAVYGTLNDNNEEKAVEVVIAFPIYVKENMDIRSRNLLIRELDERDKQYFYSSSTVPFAMAFISPGTIIKAIDMGNGWFKLHKGFIYNGSVYKNNIVEVLFAKRGSVTRVNDIMREVR